MIVFRDGWKLSPWEDLREFSSLPVTGRLLADHLAAGSEMTEPPPTE